MKAAFNTVVKITYELRTEPQGEIFDTAGSDNPLTFLHGHGNLLEKFEKNIEGLIAGEQFKFELTAEEGYGEYDFNAIVKVDKAMFAGSPVPQEQLLFVGNVIPLQDQEGNQFEGRVTSISETEVVFDMNHPLAGKTLFFSGEIIEVRAAHPEEIAHRHVHEGGHHHH
ncbi:MAG: peptidylprolyl isomerase [Chitinophagales bacterium]|nr:peptidylprolyl isomerase [Chitinophagales bacterium]